MSDQAEHHMTAEELPRLLLATIEEGLGGELRARETLFAQAYRRMLMDGPYVWELTEEQRGEMSRLFASEFEKAEPADQEHLCELVERVAMEMNEYLGPAIFVGAHGTHCSGLAAGAVVISHHFEPPTPLEMEEPTLFESPEEREQRLSKRRERDRARRAQAKARKELKKRQEAWLMQFRDRSEAEQVIKRFNLIVGEEFTIDSLRTVRG